VTKVTLRVLAEETGLSKFAVSRALAGKSGVSDATRTRVLEAAQRLGYRLPDPPRASVLGVIFDDRDHFNAELNMQIQSGLQSEAAQLGYGIRVHWMQHGEEFDHLLESCSGLLAVNIHGDADLERLRAWGRPVVRSGWTDPLEPVDTVGGTDHEAGAAAARALLDLGHREIAYVHGSENLRGRWERLYGLREVVEATPGARYHHIKWSPPQGFAQCLDDLLGTGIRPTAFFCAHDGLALTVVTDLLRRGCQIPEHASVMGFGDFSAAQLIQPALTTIRTPGRKIGMAAVRLLDARIRIPDWVQGPVRLMIPNEFVRRSSTGPAPAF
jgi:LacI family transcriptional regulator